jgi:hypothetical protein
MATMIAGAVIPGTRAKVRMVRCYFFIRFANLLPDPTAALQLHNITVQNHSYGVGIENYYGADAAAYDASLISNPSLVNIFSSGKQWYVVKSNRDLHSITGFANLTGSFKMAKNYYYSRRHRFLWKCSDPKFKRASI